MLLGYEDIYTGHDDTRIFKSDFIPYVFSRDETDRMFLALSKLCRDVPGYDSDTFRMAMLLYYCCGFRKSEVQNLKVEDIEFQTGKITVLHGKNDVSRIVVASSSLLEEMRAYHRKYLQDAALESHFLHGPKSSRYNESMLYGKFRWLLTEAGIPPKPDGGRQRLHDVRHTFCVRALEQMQKKASTCIPRFRCSPGIWGISTSPRQSITCGCWRSTLGGCSPSRIPAIRGCSRRQGVAPVNKDTFSYHLTKYFAEYLPVQTGASRNTVRSYRDVFVQLMEYYKSEYRLPPEKLEYKDFTAARIEGFLAYLESERGIGISTRNHRLAAIHAFFRYLQYRDPAGFGQCAEVLSVPFKKAPVKPMNYMSVPFPV